MTICLAVIGDARKAVVVAADRMVTAGPPMNLEFEHDCSKLEPLSDRFVAMSAGNALLCTEVLDPRALAAGLGRGGTFSDLLKLLSDRYLAVRQRKVEESVFQPIGIAHHLFIAEGTKIFPPPIYAQVFQALLAFNLGYEVLLAGVDQHGAHIAHVHQPQSQAGLSAQYDKIGYHAIGSGSIHATLALTLKGHSVSANLAQTVYDAYSAKKAAEVAPGVGRTTDMMVITDKGAKEIPAAIMKQLDELREAEQATQPDLTKLGEALHEAAGNRAGSS